MIARTSRKLSSLFISHEIIPTEDREVYEYSFEVLLSMLVSFVVLFTIAIATGTITNTMVYLAGFVPLRLLAGVFYEVENTTHHFLVYITKTTQI